MKGTVNVPGVTAAELAAKQDALTFDTTPTSGSTNPVTSGGVYDALESAGGDVEIEAGEKDWFKKIWSGLTSFHGDYVWTDGENIYYSYGTPGATTSYQYVLDKSTSTWSTKTWSGLTSFSGANIWTDGTNIYYSEYDSNEEDEYHYILDKSTSTWSAKTWNGLTRFSGSGVWTDGVSIYCSDYDDVPTVLDVATSTWSEKVWTGLTNMYGSDIWTDGENIYCSYDSDQYVLDVSNSTWSAKTWSGLTSFNGTDIWTDGENIYYSSSATQYVLDKSTSTWSTKTWTGLTSFRGLYIWTDGENIYYSTSSSTQYVLDLISLEITTPSVSAEVPTVSQLETKATVTTGTATIPAAASWSGPDDAGLYYVTVSISSFTASTNVHITPVISVEDTSTGAAQQEAWDTHYYSETVAGGIKFYAGETPTVAVTFAWEVMS